VSQTIELESIRRLDIKPGEYLVVTLPADTWRETVHQIREQMEAHLPEGVKLMLMSANVELSVLCPSNPACPADA
jgi:hypothetical protein